MSPLYLAATILDKSDDAAIWIQLLVPAALSAIQVVPPSCEFQMFPLRTVAAI